MSIRAVCVFVTNIRKRECAILGSDTRDESLSGIRDIRWQKPINWNIVPKIVFYDIGKYGNIRCIISGMVFDK